MIKDQFSFKTYIKRFKLIFFSFLKFDNKRILIFESLIRTNFYFNYLSRFSQNYYEKNNHPNLT